MKSTASTTYSMILCSLLAARWQQAGLNQQEFLKESGIATGTWSRIMRGQAHFQIEDVRAACRVLGCRFAELVSQADDIEAKLEKNEGVVVASKEALKSESSNVPTIIAGAALGFLLAKILSN